MRIFIAIPLPDPIANYVYGIKSNLATTNPDVKWVERDKYHLTLKFLGDIDTGQLHGIIKSLSAVADICTSFELYIKGIGFFPRNKKPRVIWLGIQGEVKKAEFLGERIDSYLMELGFDTEKSHRFHVTLGRVRTDKNLKPLMDQARDMEAMVLSKPFYVNEFLLMESRLTSTGPNYNILEKFKLLKD